MNHFHYHNHLLHAENVSLDLLAEKFGTPFYCYSTATLLRHYTVFAEGFKDVKATICYAVKANSNLAVLKTLASAGSGADAVSEGEIRRARAVGIPAGKIVFSGVGKTQQEMAYALKEGIWQFNVESEPELRALSEVAASLGRAATIALRINPDIDAKTHHKISTGRKGDKFGIDWQQARAMYALAATLPGIQVRAISTHIGSQLTDLKPFEQAFTRIGELVQQLRADGHTITRLDLGGGLGIPYKDEEPPLPHDYAKMAINTTRHLDCELIFEPGRLLVGNAGILVTKVIYVKHTPHRDFVIVDGAMNDLIRPSFYDAYHEIVPVKEASVTTPLAMVDVVGPVCETGDILASARALPVCHSGDLLAMRTAGAYGAVMASNYNTRLMIPEIMVNGAEYAVVRARETYEELLAKDTLPEWFGGK